MADGGRWNLSKYGCNHAMTKLRRWFRLLRRTPLHPQWLVPDREVPPLATQITGRVLDIGAADRWLQAHLSNSEQYIALDYPATGHELYGARPDVFADGAKLPFPDHCFDAVFCLEVLEHVPEPAQVMEEISRVLKPGGRAWISMPFLYPLHDAPFDFQRYTEYGLRRDAEKAHLKIEQLQRRGHALRTAGLLGCLAIAGGVIQSAGLHKGLLALFSAPLVLFINLTAWTLSFIWPNWNHINQSHTMMIRKHEQN